MLFDIIVQNSSIWVCCIYTLVINIKVCKHLIFNKLWLVEDMLTKVT